MSREVDLEKIRLSRSAEKTWRNVSKQVADTIKLIGTIRAKKVSVPNGKARDNGDGTLTVFLDVPNVLGVYVQFPAGQWGYRE